MTEAIDNLREKFRSLGLILPDEIQSHFNPLSHNDNIVDLFSGEIIHTGWGDAVIFRNQYPNNYSHGDISFEHNINILNFMKLLKPGFQDLINIEDLVFLDTETSGLAGGTGTFVFLIGFGYFLGGQFQVIQLFMRDPGEEQGLLTAFTELLGGKSNIVTFNGKSFDIPILRTRHMLHGFSFPLQDCFHLDLLHISRFIWKNRLPSRALKDLETEILHLVRSDDEVPGWLVPQIYFDYLRTGDVAPLGGVLYHNRMDIVSLAALFIKIVNLINDPIVETAYGLDLAAIARVYVAAGQAQAAINVYETSLVKGIPAEFQISTILKIANIYKKEQNWIKATPLWEKAVECGSIEACVELSKMNEHHLKDNLKALEWVEKAIELQSKSQIQKISRVEYEITIRSDRIKGKLSRV
jgi:uncharacterized protein